MYVEIRQAPIHMQDALAVLVHAEVADTVQFKQVLLEGMDSPQAAS